MQACMCVYHGGFNPLSVFFHYNKTVAHDYQEGSFNDTQLIPIGCHHRRGQKKQLDYAYHSCFRGRIEWAAEIPFAPG